VLAAPSELKGLSLANNKLIDMYIWKRCIFIKLRQPSYFIVLVELCGIEVQIFLVDNNSHTIYVYAVETTHACLVHIIPLG